MRAVLEQLHWLFLQPANCCAKNRWAILEVPEATVAFIAQQSANTLRASLAYAIWAAIVIVIDAPTLVGTGINCLAYTAYFFLFIVPVFWKTSAFKCRTNSLGLYFLWLLSIEALGVFDLLFSLFFKLNRQTFLANMPPIRLTVCHERLMAVIASSFDGHKAIWIAFSRRISMRIYQSSLLFGVASIVSTPDAFRETIRTARESAIFAYLDHWIDFAPRAYTCSCHDLTLHGDEGIVNA